MSDSYPHSGIRVDKIHIGGGFTGLLFTLVSLAIFLIGLPALWYFVAGAVASGVGMALVLRFRSR